MLIIWLGNLIARLHRGQDIKVFHFRAAWHGTRIILRQVSPESTAIFDFIIEIHRTCNGRWQSLADQTGVSIDALQDFLKYAAVFLGNIGNYYVKFGFCIVVGCC